MGRPSKTTTKKMSEKDNKTVIETSVIEEKREETPIIDNTIKEEENPTVSTNKEEKNDSIENTDVDKEETDDIIPQKDNDDIPDNPREKEEVITETKTSVENTAVKKQPRWMKDVYGYNWNGQCFDE